MRLGADWLDRPGLRAVLSALDGNALIVGGAVRNTLLGRDPGDIDLATPLRPEEVAERLEAAGLKAVPTGVEHGTVTAVAHGEPFEVTTFRADVETFGRHARVRFSESVEEDAARRDFTINALYARPDGTVVDPLGTGLPDLEARRVRFIGDPEARIREDYLRILRFFRFSAIYGEAPDPGGVAACAALADGVEGLARERIGMEMRRLLGAPDPAPALDAMDRTGVLARALPGAEPALIAPVVATERAVDVAPDWRVRLAVLGGGDPVGALRLSRAEGRFLDDLRELARHPEPPAVQAWRKGAEAALGAALLRAAAGGPAPGPELRAEVERGAGARLPLRAADLIGAGLEEGPAVGRALKRAEAAWLASDFALDRDALLREALRDLRTD